MKPHEYDGIYFYPLENSKVKYDFFNFDEEYTSPEIESSELGNKYCVVFMKQDSDGDWVYDEDFEAIFLDPFVYLKNMKPTNLAGAIMKKTEKSIELFREFVKQTKGIDDDE